jgi:hypothetical protein
MEICQSMLRFFPTAALIAMVAVHGAVGRAAEADTPAQPGAQPAPAQPGGNAAPPAQAFSVKNTFRNIAAFVTKATDARRGRAPK